MPAINKEIPPFKARATSGQEIDSNQLKGKWVVLYFYPKDNTPGCTQEGKDFRDLHIDFANENTIIFGVSKDSVKCHEGFKSKHGFPFDLIADEDGSLCELFDVFKEKSMFGKTAFGIVRSTFLISPDGVIKHIWPKVKVDGHASEVLEAIRKFKSLLKA